MRVAGFTPPRLERLIPGLYDNAFLSFLVYFALYDFAAYWVHRAQHRFAWWWALHSLHHSQRRVTVWTDDRNHVLDDLLVNLVLAVFAQFVGVQPDDFVLILMVGRLIESWSHANVDMSFGRLGERLLVGPRFHRLHHARADAAQPHIHDHNFAPVLPVWDMLFGTARFGDVPRPTGVDVPRSMPITAAAGSASRRWCSNGSLSALTPSADPGGAPPIILSAPRLSWRLHQHRTRRKAHEILRCAQRRYGFDGVCDTQCRSLSLSSLANYLRLQHDRELLGESGYSPS